MIPVEGHQNLFRDPNSGAIINCDSFGYSQYMKSKSEKQRQREELDQIKSDITEIKQLLKEILNGSN
jgi:hypothetical protein